MYVLKFGGTSVGDANRIKEVAKLIHNGNQNLVVLSAMSGSTNALEEIAGYLYKKNHEGANDKINQLQKHFLATVEELFASEAYKEKGRELVESHMKHLHGFTVDMFTLYEEKEVLAQGEMISTAFMQYYLEEQGISSALLSALDFMRTNKMGEPDHPYIKEHLAKVLEPYADVELFITQGYICRNHHGMIDNLKRGGSDYTASIIGAALEVEEIQIWTDIDGVHSNDPRIVENTHAIAQLSFDEAAELAYFGAKILHPTCVLPAKMANIPVRIKNTLDPAAEGTLISGSQRQETVKAIAAKDGITAIKIKSGRMLMAHGFLRKVFEIFETYKTSIDMITTSEVGVSVTIDDASALKEIVDDLQNYGTVHVDEDQVIICVVGDLIAESKGVAASVFKAVQDIPLRMISYGGSNHNISMLVDAKHKKEALVALSKGLFND